LGETPILWFGAATTLVIAATAILVWYFTQDDFNFSDEQSPQLKIENTAWSMNGWTQPITISLHQSQVTIYWHSEDQISWKCKGLNPEIDLSKGKLDIRHNKCLIFLPRPTSDHQYHPSHYCHRAASRERLANTETGIAANRQKRR
jgi:hypothetical protein